MRSFNPFTSVSGRYTLFEIRLENDFIVFRGNEDEAPGQLLKGTVVLCVSSPLKVETIQLKLTGAARYAWTDTKTATSGVSSYRIDKVVPIFEHRWPPFEGVGAVDPEDSSRRLTKGVTLPPGNYEWPFELMLDGDTTESIEGLREASIQYRLKATVTRSKLVHDIHAEKPLRVIRTLEPSALEFLHAMSIENIWPNKMDYSIAIPQKAVVFGSCIPVEMRFTPLLKGLEIGKVTLALIEVHDFVVHANAAYREHKKEREVETWVFPVTREEHWQDVIQGSGPDGWEGQEGWVVNKSFGLPKRLTRCLQSVHAKGIKIRHKLKVVVSLNNPDGHVSELRATLPVSIFISPNMPPDEDGTVIRQLPGAAPNEAVAIAPPAYEHHRLDQLYEDIEPAGFYPPSGAPSGVSSPFRGHSRAGSTDNIPAMLQRGAIQPDLLAYRLHSMSLEQRHRNLSWNSNLSAAGTGSLAENFSHPGDGSPSTPLTRHSSGGGPSGFNTPPQHLDYPEVSELSKVPSYQTAVKTPVRPLTAGDSALPDYQTALSAPSSAPGTPRLRAAAPIIIADNLETVVEPPQEPPEQGSPAQSPAFALSPASAPGSRNSSPRPHARRRAMPHRRQFSSGFLHSLFHGSGDGDGDGDENRRLHLLQARSG